MWLYKKGYTKSSHKASLHTRGAENKSTKRPRMNFPQVAVKAQRNEVERSFYGELAHSTAKRLSVRCGKFF